MVVDSEKDAMNLEELLEFHLSPLDIELLKHLEGGQTWTTGSLSTFLWNSGPFRHQEIPMSRIASRLRRLEAARLIRRILHPRGRIVVQPPFEWLAPVRWTVR